MKIIKKIKSFYKTSKDSWYFILLKIPIIVLLSAIAAFLLVAGIAYVPYYTAVLVEVIRRPEQSYAYIINLTSSDPGMYWVLGLIYLLVAGMILSFIIGLSGVIIKFIKYKKYWL